MFKILQKSFFFFLLLISTNLAMAAGLTDKQVKNYLASVPDALVLGDKYNQEQKNIDPMRPLSSGLELMGKTSSSYKELSALAKKHQFENAEEWADVGDRVMQAYIALQSDIDLDGMRTNYNQAVKSITADPKMSEAAKQGTLKGMEKGYLRNVKIVTSAQPDLPAVKSNITAIDAVFD